MEYYKRNSDDALSQLNVILDKVKVGVGDLRSMPLIKKSHVAYSKFFSRFDKK
jgi:hypothetical protein